MVFVIIVKILKQCSIKSISYQFNTPVFCQKSKILSKTQKICQKYKKTCFFEKFFPDFEKNFEYLKIFQIFSKRFFGKIKIFQTKTKHINTHIYIKFKVLRYDSNGYSSICGNYNSANNSITLYVGQNNANYVIRFGSYNRQYFPIGETNKDYIIEYNKNIITINEETYNVGANNTFSTNGSLYIFGRNVNGSLGTGALIGRIYYFRIYEDEKKVGDLIPCLDSDGRKCMYDTVSGTPLYNQGTGDFTAGPEVQGKKYLQIFSLLLQTT